VNNWVLASSVLGAIGIGLVAGQSAPATAAPNTGEVIEIYGCGPGQLELGENGPNMVCVDPNPLPGGGGDFPDDPTGDQDGGGGGGGADPQSDAAEQKRKQRCKKCRANKDKCVDQAFQSQKNCVDTAHEMALHRCSPGLANGVGNTITPWGYSIGDLKDGGFKVLEAGFADKKKWAFECSTGRGGGIQACDGPAIDTCVTAWRVSHPKIEGGISVTLEGSATFDPVGLQASATFTGTVEWDGKTGYNAACAGLGMNLSHSCTGRQNQCETKYSCTEADFE
jgi:hypothetical protein